MKRLLPLIIIALLIVPGLSVDAQERDPAVRGVEWLATQQLENGSFDDDVNLTASAVIAFAAIGEDNEAALTWLENAILESGAEMGMEEISSVVAAVVAAGLNPNTFADGKLIEYHVLLLRQEQGEVINTLCSTLTSMINLNQPLSEGLLQSLMDGQNEDGGFGVAPSDDASNIAYTAFCIPVLVAAEADDAVEAALEFLRESQNEDGGWNLFIPEGESDPLGTAYAIQALLAAEVDLETLDNPEFALVGFQDRETGEFVYEIEGAENNLSIPATIVAVVTLRGLSFTDFVYEPGEADSTTEEATTSEDGIPALNSEWAPIADGFGMDELDTADDFFVTVVDPFTDDELYGVQIINWTAEYTYTGYIIEEGLTAEILIWMAETEPETWDHLNNSVLRLLPASELEQLPEEIRSRIED